jgi:hypothetical protein
LNPSTKTNLKELQETETETETETRAGAGAGAGAVEIEEQTQISTEEYDCIEHIIKNIIEKIIDDV